MTKRIATAALGVLLLAAGCATSTPTDYYTLDMRAAGATSPAVNLVVDRLTLAEAIADGRLPIRTSPTEMTYYASAHWVNSVDELVREKLAAEFGPMDPSRKSLALMGHLHAFGQIDRPDGGADAHVKLALSVREAGASRYADPLLEKIYEARVPAETADANSVVIALSRCMEAIATEIARDTAQL